MKRHERNGFLRNPIHVRCQKGDCELVKNARGATVRLFVFWIVLCATIGGLVATVVVQNVRQQVLAGDRNAAEEEARLAKQDSTKSKLDLAEALNRRNQALEQVAALNKLNQQFAEDIRTRLNTARLKGESLRSKILLRDLAGYIARPDIDDKECARLFCELFDQMIAEETKP